MAERRVSWRLPALILAVLAAAAIWNFGLRKQARKPPSPPLSKTTTITVYYHRTGQPDQPPSPVRRVVTTSATLTPSQRLKQALGFLLSGPTGAQKKAGYYSALPPGVKLLSFRLDRPLATIDFDAELEKTGGTAKVAAILDELSYTAASISGIKGTVLKVEGERVGTDAHPFTGEGFLFHNLHPPVDSAWAARLGPADALDLFIAVIPVREDMWKMMGPKIRQEYKSPNGIEVSAFSEGLGAWRDYRVEKQEIDGNEATVVIAGRQRLEGAEEPEARYEARMIKEDGRWKFDGGTKL